MLMHGNVHLQNPCFSISKNGHEQEVSQAHIYIRYIDKWQFPCFSMYNYFDLNPRWFGWAQISSFSLFLLRNCVSELQSNHCKDQEFCKNCGKPMFMFEILINGHFHASKNLFYIDGHKNICFFLSLFRNCVVQLQSSPHKDEKMCKNCHKPMFMFDLHHECESCRHENGIYCSSSGSRCNICRLLGDSYWNTLESLSKTEKQRSDSSETRQSFDSYAGWVKWHQYSSIA